MTDVTNITNEIAIFAGGCFWCMVQPFDEITGVIKVTSGYTGGTTVDPSYEEVCKDTTGHYEAVKVQYDPTKVKYSELLDIYFKQIDPTDSDGQFGDKGSSYKPAVFYTTEVQKDLAEQYKQDLAKSGKFDRPIVVEILPGEVFYNAEEYHQDFYKKDPSHYNKFKKGSGREDFINEN